LPPFQQPDLFSTELTRVNTGESTGESTRADACSGEGKGKERKGRKEGGAVALDLPFQSEGFREAWQKWEIFRREIKKPLTNSTIKMQLKQVEAWGEQRSIKIIDNCVLNGWYGLKEYSVSNVTPIQMPSTKIYRKPQTSDNYGI
jgi:hypothetical protein